MTDLLFDQVPFETLLKYLANPQAAKIIILAFDDFPGGVAGIGL